MSTLEERLEAVESMSLDEALARRERVAEFLDEDDGPARWFYEARREYRALTERIKALEGVTHG